MEGKRCNMELIVEEKNFHSLPIDKLVEASWNYKDDDEVLQEKLAENIKRNKQIENIIVRELDTGFYEVVNGNHRYKAMKNIGASKVMVYNLGKVSLNEAKKIAYETNETKFNTIDAKLNLMLKELSEDYSLEELSKTSPFELEEIKHRIESLDFNFDAFAKVPTITPSDKEGFKIVSYELPDSVAEQFEAQVDRVKQILNPNDSLDDILPIQAIECITQHIAQIPDEQIV